jgi:hypothetical protein
MSNILVLYLGREPNNIHLKESPLNPKSGLIAFMEQMKATLVLIRLDSASVSIYLWVFSKKCDSGSDLDTLNMTMSYLSTQSDIDI